MSTPYHRDHGGRMDVAKFICDRCGQVVFRNQAGTWWTLPAGETTCGPDLNGITHDSHIPVTE